MEKGYYRYIEHNNDFDNSNVTINDLFYVYDFEEDNAKAVHGDSTWTVEIETILNCFEFVPNGEQEIKDEIADLMLKMETVDPEQESFINQTAIPYIEDEEETSEVTDISAIKNDNDVIKMQDKINQFKKNANTAHAKIELYQERIDLLLKEQMLIFEKSRLVFEEHKNALFKKKEMIQKQVKSFEENLHILNSYLGQDEEIVQIQKGKPASPDMKITMRQLILYTDEETALDEDYAKKGGIDSHEINEFDKWVVKPENLHQVLPEEKGIVAFKPRRNDKFYDKNPFINADMNRENKCLYILIRNGENVYRIFTNLWLEDVLFPRKNEHEKFFYRTERDWKTNKLKRIPLKPGSREYMKAMENSVSHQKRFFSALLLLQGIIDRTKVFEPLPKHNPRINICDVNEAGKHSKFMYDAERTLSDGKIDFNKWLEEINSKMDVGVRVAMSSDVYKWDEDYDKRVSPERAELPDSETLYIIEDKKQDKFIFRYKRNEKVYIRNRWGDYEYREAKNRASFYVYKYDKFVFNFDNASLEDIEYYLHSRVHRHNYISMVPLLQIAYKLKKQEQTEEKPFKQLLVGEIAKSCKVPHSKAEDKIDELVKWWKFKNKTHRALTSDDVKAIRMIVKEFEKRNELDEKESKKQDLYKKVIEHVKKENTIAIFNKKANLYSVFNAHNKNNVFITEEIWKVDRSKNIVLVESKEWKIVDKRHESWKLLWNHDRWNDWEIGADVTKHLTDPELEIGLQKCLDYSKIKKEEDSWYSRNDCSDWDWNIPLAKDYGCSNPTIYFAARHATSDENVKFGRVEMEWYRKKEEVEFVQGYYCVRIISIDTDFFDNDNFYIYEENLKEALKETKEFDRKQQIIENKIDSYDGFLDQVSDHLTNIVLEDEKKKFDELYNDTEDGSLWEKHKKDLNIKKNSYWLTFPMKSLFFHGIDPEGMTIEEVVNKAIEVDDYSLLYNKDDFKEIKHIIVKK